MAEIKEVIFDPYTPEKWPDPIPQYRALVKDHPAYYLEKRDIWILSRYDDIITAAKDWKTFSSARNGNALMDMNNRERLGNTLGTSDPPKHMQYRRIVGEVFTPRFVAGLEPAMRKTVRELVGKFKNKNSFDAQWDIAYPYSATIVGIMIGVPKAEMDNFVDLLASNIRMTNEQKENLNFVMSNFTKMVDLCTNLVEKKMSKPENDIISKLIAAEIDGRSMTPKEIGITTLTLIGAAFQSAGMAIGCGLSTLSKHPEQLAEVCENYALIPALVEETLRYDGTTIGFVRTTTRDVELHGKVIPEGARVFLAYGAANHDESRFPNPERFDIHRENNKHLGFGYGPHTCIGAPMARLMMKVAFEELLTVIGNKFEVQYDRSELATTVQFRGYDVLSIAF
jgi:cytochrome P450